MRLDTPLEIPLADTHLMRLYSWWFNETQLYQSVRHFETHWDSSTSAAVTCRCNKVFMVLIGIFTHFTPWNIFVEMAEYWSVWLWSSRFYHLCLHIFTLCVNEIWSASVLVQKLPWKIHDTKAGIQLWTLILENTNLWIHWQIMIKSTQ